jgi:hypothetical protein
MRQAKSAIASCLKMVSGHPLHLAAALLAAFVSETLSIVQPQFLRAFIDASAKVAVAKLWPIPALMAASAVLGYAFHTISVSIRELLQKNLSRQLKEAYLEFGDLSRPEHLHFSLRKGIQHLSQLTLSLTVDFFLVLTRLAMISLFLILAQPALGGIVIVMLAVAVSTSLRLTSLLGKTSRAYERASGRLVAAAKRDRFACGSSLDRIERLEKAKFKLTRLNLLPQFLLFRLMPAAVLALFLFDKRLTLGSLTSIFLYLSMLRAPYQEFVQKLQEAQASISEVALFRGDLERSLALSSVLSSTRAGLIWLPGSDKRGKPLSAGAAPVREFFDDMPPGDEKDRRVRELARAAEDGSICLHSSDPGLAALAHFRLPPGGPLTLAMPQ